MSDFREQLIRLGQTHKNLRPHIRAILGAKTSSQSKMSRRTERQLIDIAEAVIDQYEDTYGISYLPNMEYLEGSIDHYLEPRRITLTEDEWHYVLEYIKDYWA